MSLRMEKKHISILLAAAFLAILLYLGAFFLYITPLKGSLALKESQLKSEQQLSTAIEARLASANDSEFSSTMEMQKMLPVDPMTEQLMLDLEKAEVVSNSYIISMEFNNSSQSDMVIQAEENQKDNSAAEVQDQGTVIRTADTSKAAFKMPEGLAKSSVVIIVESENYFDLEKFIETLENLKRLVMVESIAFSGPEEIDSISGDDKPIKMTLTLNAFYLSGLGDLKDHNPKIETPEPANKRNPFPTFGNYSEENLTEINGTDENPSEDTDDE